MNISAEKLERPCYTVCEVYLATNELATPQYDFTVEVLLSDSSAFCIPVILVRSSGALMITA